MTGLVQRQDFASCLNARFVVRAAGLDSDGPATDLELIEVSDEHRTGVQSTFSLLFRGPAGRPLAQRTYHLRHATLGDMAVFLVPVGRDDAGLHYQAVFNRLVDG